MIWAVIAAAVLFVLVFPKYVLGPILVKRTNFQPANPRFEPIADDNLVRSVPSSFLQRAIELQSLGFTLVDHYTMNRQLENQTLVFSLYVNRATNDAAGVIFSVVFTDSSPTFSADFLEFSTHFTDGFELDTNNISTPRIFYDSPTTRVYKIPHIRDSESLYRVHGYLVSREKRRKAPLPPGGTEIDAVRESSKASLQHQVVAGTFYLDPVRDRYCYTWKGAILTTWRLIWPFSAIIQRTERRNGYRLARSAGLK